MQSGSIQSVSSLYGGTPSMGWHRPRSPLIAQSIGPRTLAEIQILTDPNGSRRFLCVEELKRISEEPLIHKQIYAQLKAELEAGEPDFLSQEEERLIQENNKAYYR